MGPLLSEGIESHREEPAETMMLKRHIDEFEIDKPIGVGSVGTIYRARDLKNKREVALKILLASVSRDPLISARFEREMVILEKLSHPNIVRYFGGGRTDDQLFFAMELMTGGSLKDLMTRSGALSFLEAVACGVQLASALQHAHNYGIIHRDLKPSNLLFDQAGALKLVDFGVARDTHEADLTNSGMTVGSYAYMAPEQIQGQSGITGHVDLYAFGCLMFEILTGRPPFRGDNFAQIFEQHLRSEAPPLRSLVPGIPEEMEQLVTELLKKSPEERPFSARAVQGRLLQMVDPDVAQPGSSGDVSAADVIDRGRESLARRIQDTYREVSWPAVAGVFVVGTVAAVLAWWVASNQ